MTTLDAQIYNECLDDLKSIGVSSNSFDDYAEKAIQIIKEKIDFLFVGIALLDTTYSVRFYKGTGDKYYQRRMTISLKSSDPIAHTIRNGIPLLLVVDDNVFKNPVFPDEKIQFFLPLISQEGVFGAIEIISSMVSDENSTIKTFSNLETLSSEIALSCIKFMDKNKIGHWKQPCLCTIAQL